MKFYNGRLRTEKGIGIIKAETRAHAYAKLFCPSLGYRTKKAAIENSKLVFGSCEIRFINCNPVIERK